MVVEGLKARWNGQLLAEANVQLQASFPGVSLGLKEERLEASCRGSESKNEAIPD